MSVQLELKKKMNGFTLDIHFSSDAKRIGILGASGAGKSMILKCIAGIEKPDEGLIRLDQRILYQGEKGINPKPQSRKVGYMFQNYALFPHMTVKENIGIGIKGRKEERNRIVESFLERFRLTGLESRFPSEISGGQQQRVALARILAYDPEAILLDEPFSSLDIYLKDRLFYEMTEILKDYEGTVILVSHNRDEIYRFSEELLIIDQGRTVISGNTKDLFSRPKKKEAAVITGCKNIVSAERKGQHELYIPDWNMSLFLTRSIPDNISWVGVRAHDFLPVWGEKKKNCLPFLQSRIDELPFETNYYLLAPSKNGEDICWFVQRDTLSLIREKGNPDYLEISEEKILLLY